jgi:hypothetical protein
MADMFRVDPTRLTAVREAYDKALDELRPQLEELSQVGHVDAPWLGDDVSEAVRVHYNTTVMGPDAGGAYQAMRKYEAELRAVRDQFAEMERAYLAGESTNVDRARQVGA